MPAGVPQPCQPGAVALSRCPTGCAVHLVGVPTSPLQSLSACIAPRIAKRLCRQATGGRGADAVLEVVGSPSALRAAYELVRPGGTISSVGCHTEPTFPFSPVDAYNKNITLKSGRCSARHYMDRLLPLVRSGKYDITAVISHRLPLLEGPEAYRMFDSRAEGCTKVVFYPQPQSEAAEAQAA